MKLNKFGQFTAAALLSFAGLSVQAAEVWSESFETDGQGVRYVATPEFTDAGNDYWLRTDGVGLPAGPYTGKDGTYFWAAEDVDGEGGTDEPEIVITGINISGVTNLMFSGLFAAGDEGGLGNSEYDSTDFIKIQHQIDGGGYVDGMCFGYEDNGDAFNEPIGLDSDCNGLSDGISGWLNRTLTNYSYSIAGTGSTLDLKIIVSVNGGDEEIALDHLILSGDGGGGGDIAPTVASTIPSDGTSGVADNTDITINFSENINATANAVTMSCTTSGAVTFSAGLPALDVDQLVLTPTSALTDGESCDVTVVAAEIVDTDGTPDNMAADYDFSFLVGYPTVEIFEIQGSGMASPYDGQTVSTNNNIVTVLSDSGFYIQTPDARDDLDNMTSNGIYVYTGGAPTVSVGDEVNVTGEIDEYFDLTEFASPGSQTITVISSGNALPTAVLLDDSYPPTDPTQFPCGSEPMGFECVESMWFDMPQGYISSTYTSFFGANSDDLWVKAGSSRAFREPGIDYPGEVGLPVFDGNPELLEVDMDGLGLGLPLAGYSAGSEVSITGVFGYDFGEYEIWPSVFTVVNENTLPSTVPAATSEELTIGSLNLFRLFDDVDDPGPEDDGQVADPLEYAMRLDKFAKYIVENMNAPMILGIQEVENLNVMNDLASAISFAGGPSYNSVLVDGNDVGGIDVAYFFNADSVTNVSIDQLGKTEIFTYDGSLLHDRPPLQLSADIMLDQGLMPVEVLNVHMRSRGGIDDAGDGDRVRNKRLAQAQSVAQMVEDIETDSPNAAVYVIGDFNAFQFTDGYVDVMGQIAGTAVDADNMLWETPIYAASPLTVATDTVAPAEQYSYIYRGDAQALDHAVLNDRALMFFTQMRYVRGQADAALQYEDDGSSALRSTDHDGFVLYANPDLDLIFENGFE